MSEIRHVHHLALTPVRDVAPHQDATDRDGPGGFREHDIRPFPGGMMPPTWPLVPAQVQQGACRHLIAGRLDIGGARWGPDGAEAVLTLRAVISNGDFREYWRFHLERGHQRLYPGTTQGRYALAA